MIKYGKPPRAGRFPSPLASREWGFTVESSAGPQSRQGWNSSFLPKYSADTNAPITDLSGFDGFFQKVR